MFRDGFKVNPYGNPDDDWLSLDRTALASSGYKVSRAQIVGKVDISSIYNPKLTDQTNREGLCDCEEKHVFVLLLQHIMEKFHVFLDSVDDEFKKRETLTFDELEDRVDKQESQIQDGIHLLLNKYPEVKKDPTIINSIKDAVNHIQALMENAKKLANSIENDRPRLVHLAGLGLMVEILAHELNRSTRHTLAILADADQQRNNQDISSLFATLQEELKTLQKRLRILDPLSTAGRQVKEHFDMVEWVNEVLSSHEAQFKRHGVNCSVILAPSDSSRKMDVYMVKGMIVQIFENLISNSIYWLNKQRILERNFMPKITITINTRTKTILFSDNGPGISVKRRNELFQPFITTKPPGEGKGLGLYISHEIATYNGAELSISDECDIHDGYLNTFILQLEVKK